MAVRDPKSQERPNRDPNFTREDFEFLARLDLGAHRVLGALVVLTALFAAVYKVASGSEPWRLRVFLLVSALLVFAIVRDSFARRVRPMTVILWTAWGSFVAYALWWR